MEGWPYAREIEQAPPGYVQIFEKPSHEEISNNSLDEQLKAVEEYPEPLPVPQAQLSNDDLKGPLYKKSGSHYRKFYLFLLFTSYDIWTPHVENLKKLKWKKSFWLIIIISLIF